ncbi:serine hydrolase domain-containing protein [Paenibacillus macquariensis]|uniref:CubicO group peptidase, beta-lactamase class C family n=1 Tax=Paenibacillus macquariensis TaxID=948756 RepID=A0ABY1JU10_9BACL|nr:serine hydrolase domain-containing protein [Paenibacillus macquariensis]MEC0091019.1 serine hydrolase [Paenibacillus macquariensis]OAB34737.1 hypothetical protein PMSM_12885 [Paenibacillus macquariensis subsp. macquariensis]SIQ78451.1 CubicO group peptidase, beta-lactamase class C family [Paenibacillus macquariensis]
MSLSLETQLDNVICPQDFLVGGAVTVVKDNQIVYGKGFGRSRLGENEQDFTPDTIVSIQSISKSFTAALLLQLVEDGKLELDAPLVQYLPYFRTTDILVSNTITVEQLLSHTAGFSGDIGSGNLLCPNIREFSMYDEMKEQCMISNSILQRISNREDVTKSFESITLSHTPGTNWSYCTEAYMIAADLFEKVSGKKWDECMEDLMTKRLHLKRTTLDAEKVQEDENSAQYYCSHHNVNEHNLETNVSESPFPINALGAPMGFIYSTANDLCTYLASYMNDNPFMSQAMIDHMYEPVWRFDEKEGYSLGWGIRQHEGHIIIEHGGGFPGVSAYVCMVPSKKIGVVVVSNHDETPSQNICYAVLDSLLQKYSD